MGQAVWCFLAALYIVTSVARQQSNSEEKAAELFLEKINRRYKKEANLYAKKLWDYYTNVTTYNQEQYLNQEVIYSNYSKNVLRKALTFNTSEMKPTIQRQFMLIKGVGVAAQPDHAKVKELASIVSDMQTIYNTAEMCLKPGERCLMISSDTPTEFSTSRDYDELLKMWAGWRNGTGQMTNLYSRYVELSNEAVQFLGFKDLGELWRFEYESTTFVNDVEQLFNQLLPLYQHVHAYVRTRLKAIYGESKFPTSGHIPAHLLGSVWSLSLGNLFNLVKPFEEKPFINVTEEMIKQNYTVDKMFNITEDFFLSLGFPKLPPSFWTKSMFTKPDDGRQVICHAAAFDMHKNKDVRIKMCTNVHYGDLKTAHHEMGHLYYFLAYRNQPALFTGGANPGFHEAVGDAIALSVQTSEHLKKLGLLDEVLTDNETDINFLMNMALQTVTALPYRYLIDKWRWSVFSGQTTNETYIKDYWAMICNLSGISPPVERSEDDFEPGYIYHVASDVPVIRYFISTILQFQFHEGLCQAANYTGPLHRCDIYNNTRAGQKFKYGLRLGQSLPWPMAMKKISQRYTMSAKSMMRYFNPLLKFLRKKNGRNFGWDASCTAPT